QELIIGYQQLVRLRLWETANNVQRPTPNVQCRIGKPVVAGVSPAQSSYCSRHGCLYRTAPDQVLRNVNRLFAVSHKRNRTSCWFSRLSILGQSARTIFSPVEGASRKSSVSRSRCRSRHGSSDSSMAFRNATKA